MFLFFYVLPAMVNKDELLLNNTALRPTGMVD